MIVEQMYTNCLAQAAYWVESEGEALVIDPLRDYKIYTEKAAERGVKIKYILETHFHADFVSGHIDLSNETGAPIIYGPGAQTQFPITILEDEQELQLGKITIKALHTPGHTPESTCYLLKDEQGKDYCVFTGDTLFVGDVGRPDLLDKNQKYSKETLASWLFDSLNTKLKNLDDAVIVYPGHGPGSSCGKNLGPETFSTVGEQKESNYAMQAEDKATFVDQVLEGIKSPPAYFFESASMNKNGYSNLDEFLDQSLNAFSLEDFENQVAEGALILDTRIPDIFEKGFVPGSLNIGLNGQYAIWAAELIDLDRKIVIVCSKEKHNESITRLARVGFKNIVGYLDGGFDTYEKSGKETDMIISIDAYEFSLDYKHDDIELLDVRKKGEWESSHLPKAKHICLSQLADHLEDIPNTKKPIYIHCAGGYRSMIAASFLRKNGYPLIKNILGGFTAIQKEEGLEFETAVEEVSS
jgi:glyoxylase-like metal-dependent hydrolase (beta-lactamase superfamily II)/rhodanese-related sulfurtransferase